VPAREMPRAAAVGYDPIQRAEQWKRRCDREDIFVCKDLDREVLQGGFNGTMLGALGFPETMRAATHGMPPSRGPFDGVGAGAGTTLKPTRGYTPAGRSVGSRLSTPRSMGQNVAMTPRLSGTGDATLAPQTLRLPGTAGTLGSNVDSIRSGESASSTLLRARLEEELKEKAKMAQELQMLQALLYNTGESGERILSARGSSHIHSDAGSY